ncbi:PilN domain-containing protein [Chitinimonas sp. BJYL2]|uniref:PilN domain-containing protein n=1 Tax=Chitinimonas sp. BJYL2 TaxID=2976696 RepID=UPI0022B4DCC7|nr:PilN domain-containing protein [Chitinimonas sp. BJYL2]
MIRINLLPHREQKRKARATRFAILSVVAVAVGLGLVGVAYAMVSAQIANQEERNAFLEEENAKLEKQIAEIETLKKERQLLLDRKKVVERLQSNRAESVQIFDQIVRQMPEGMYLREFKQSTDSVTLIGYTQSSARVSTLMRSLNDSPIFEQPNLVQIEVVQNKERDAKQSAISQRLSEFTLTVRITREEPEPDPSTRKGGKAKEAGK